MLPFRVLVPFLAIAGGTLLVLVFALVLLGNNADRRADAEVRLQLQQALADEQWRLQRQLERLEILYANLTPFHFLQLLPFQLDQQCLIWLRDEYEEHRGTCVPETLRTPQLLDQLERIRDDVGLTGGDPVLLYHYREMDGFRLWLVQPLGQPLLDTWRESLQLPAMQLKSHDITISGESQVPLLNAEGEALAYLHYTLPRPGHDLVRAALLPLLLLLLFLSMIGLLAVRKLWRLAAAREQSETQLRQVIDLVPHMIYARDLDGRFLLANKAAGRFFNVPPEAMLGQTLVQLTGDDQVYEPIEKRDQALMLSGGACLMEEEVLPGQGGPTVWQTSKLQFNDGGGRPALLGISIDVTGQRLQQEQLQLLSSALENSGSAVLLCDAGGLIRYANARFRDLSGKQVDALLGQSLQQLLGGSLMREQRRFLLRALRHQGNWRGEVRLHLSGDRHYWMMVSVAPVHLQNQQQTHFVVVAEDITELKLAQQKMEQLALYDTLTGLENRRLFKQRLHKAIKLAKRQRSLCALLYLDLDHFKRINDTLGHDAGDLLLTTVADRLRSCVRDSDSIARLGGDEFTVLLQELHHPESAAQVARKITERLAEPIQLGSKSVIVTTSVGITLAPMDGDVPSELMKNADLAMYRAKGQGRNTFQFFTPEMNVQANRLLELETEMREALEERSFEVWYQPQIDLQQRRVVGFEALARWLHPHRGRIAPAEFIPVAEETGLIVDLGYQVLEQACRDIGQINLGMDQPCYVAVNLSPRQLRDDRLLVQLKDLLDLHRLPPGLLELEITESTLMDQMDLSLPILHQIDELGVSLTIDDFGTGYSSLSYLKRLPVHSLKIDRSFVQDVPRDRDDVAIVSAVSAMAAELHLEVVAEGVEHPEQLEFLRDCSCNLAQGFYFSAPVPVEQLLETCRNIETRLLQ